MTDKLQTYEEAARVIALYLDEFCDKGLNYVNMIADASRRANNEIIKLRGRPDTKEEKLITTNKAITELLCELIDFDENYNDYCTKGEVHRLADMARGLSATPQ